MKKVTATKCGQTAVSGSLSSPNLVAVTFFSRPAPAARRNDDDHGVGACTFLVAHGKDGVIREYDAVGKVSWEFDVALFDKPKKGGHGPEGFGDQASSAVRLANGNTLLVNCHAGPDNTQTIDVPPEKQVVWIFKDFTTFGNSLPVAVVLDP